MAVLAYLLPPLSGLLVYLKGSSVRHRFHGLQSVLLGLLWPVALYAASWIPPGATQFVFVAGALIWVVLVAAAAAGRDPALPGGRRLLTRLAHDSPRGQDFSEELL